jgi:hypothetical protein
MRPNLFFVIFSLVELLRMNHNQSYQPEVGKYGGEFMIRRIPLSALIGQEKRSVNLFVILLLTVIFMIDLITVHYFTEGVGIIILLPYGFLYLLIPTAIYFKKRNPRYIYYK